MYILAMETTGPNASAALLRAAEPGSAPEPEIMERAVLLGQQTSYEAKSHLKNLMPLIQKLLTTCGVEKSQLTHIAVSVGPGSFTGIRIGVSAAKGLAFSLDKPAAAVSTLAAMARNAAFAGGLILCAMDARRGQIYNAVFSAEGGVLTRLTPDRAISLAELAEELRPDARPKIAVGDGARLCAGFLNQTGIPCQLAPPHLMMQNAMSVALEAEALALEGRLVDAQALLPVYLRPPQAERLRKAERR